MKFNFKFNGFESVCKVANDEEVVIKLDGIEIEYECTTQEFVENIKYRKELMAKLPELVKQIKEAFEQADK